MCIRNQVFVDLKMLLYRLAHPFFYMQNPIKGAGGVFSIRLCYLPLLCVDESDMVVGYMGFDITSS